MLNAFGRWSLATLVGVNTLVILVFASNDPVPTKDELAAATFEGIYGHPVTLKDGRWEGEPFVEGGSSRPSVGLVEDFSLTGDLDADGSKEAVVFLWESSGGSGTRSYLAVMSRRENQIINLGTSLIGDRVQLKSGCLADQRIALEVVQQGPKDAACCPSQMAFRVWTLGVNGLEEQEQKVTGTLSPTDLAGEEWVLTQLSWNEPAPLEPQITLVLDDQQFVGQSGCNRYFVQPQVGAIPGELTVGPIAGTRMACPEEVMELENRYLEALATVMKFGFLNGKLALTWRKSGDPMTMLFKARTP